jgi:hypothetical protein
MHAMIAPMFYLFNSMSKSEKPTQLGPNQPSNIRPREMIISGRISLVDK